MKNYTKKMRTNLLFLLGLSITIFSCTDDLSVEPGDDNAFLADEFYSNPEAYKQALAGIYSNFAITGTSGENSSSISGIDAGTSQYGRGLMNLQTFTTDEAIWSYENDPGLRELNRNIWTASNPIFRGMYGRAMFEVALVNEFLRQTNDNLLDSRNVDGDLRSQIKTFRAEARLLRALAYYHLMDLFGKAAFVTEDDPIGAYQAPQIERPELFNFIESELLAINDDLMDSRENEYARADKAVAWMILAKIYLNAEVYIGENKYENCMDQIQKILDAGYGLSPEYKYLFLADNDANPGTQEIIFSWVSDAEITKNYGPTTVMINGSVGNIEKNGEEIGVSAGGWGGAIRVTRQFSELFLNDPDTFENDSRNNLITADRPIDITDIADRKQGYVITKFSNIKSNGEHGKGNRFVDTDFPVFRLADVYLMYAEVHLRGGGGSISQAVDYINQLRERANGGDATNNITATDLTLDFILEERLRELHWESHRRQDLIRFDKYTGGSYNWAWKGNVANGTDLPNHLSVFPLPSESLASNPNLTQNPGY